MPGCRGQTIGAARLRQGNRSGSAPDWHPVPRPRMSTIGTTPAPPVRPCGCGPGTRCTRHQALFDGIKQPAPSKSTGCGCGPPLWTKAWNYAASTASWVSRGMRGVTEAQYQERQRICEGCPALLPNLTCAACGCPVSKKAGRNTTPGASDCPQGKWPQIE